MADEYHSLMNHRVGAGVDGSNPDNSSAKIDITFMRQALALAQKGEFTAHPNPRVGCLLVVDQKIVGQGLHWQAGTPHAECHALEAAGALAKGATCYVTLEPCIHQGKTGPCVVALIQAGIKRVVYAVSDPNPAVAGKGAIALKEAGIEVTVGVLEKDARMMNIGFFSRMERQKPYVRAKIAMSLDGRTAMANGESQWITSDLARQDAHRWRARSGAILTTSQTLNLDDCRLTARDLVGLDVLPKGIHFQQPLRVVIDSHLRSNPLSAIFKQAGKTVIAISESVPLAKQKAWLSQCGHDNVTCITLPLKFGGLDIQSLLLWLGKNEINDLLIEAGPTFVGSLIQHNLIDELLVYIAPKFLGHGAREMLTLPGLSTLSQHIAGNFEKISHIGPDLSINISLCNNKEV